MPFILIQLVFSWRECSFLTNFPILLFIVSCFCDKCELDLFQQLVVLWWSWWWWCFCDETESCVCLFFARVLGGDLVWTWLVKSAKELLAMLAKEKIYVCTIALCVQQIKWLECSETKKLVWIDTKNENLLGRVLSGDLFRTKLKIKLSEVLGRLFRCSCARMSRVTCLRTLFFSNGYLAMAQNIFYWTET